MVEVSNWFTSGESWVSNGCKRDLAAGGVHCGRREKLPGWEHWEEVLNVKVKFSEWGFVYAPAGGTATPLPGTGEHVMNLKRESRILELKVLVKLNIITLGDFKWLTSFFMAKQPWISQGTVVHLEKLIGKCLTICIISLLEFHLTACSSSWAAAAICPLSLFSIFCRFSRHPTIFCRVQGVLVENV